VTSYRGPDGDVDLEEALGPHLQHYVGIMVSGAAGTRTALLALGRSETPHGVLLRQGFGRPTRASSCGSLAPSPGWSWDVCGYYVILGVRWTATKGEIRRAYLAACMRNGGQQDERLTYVMAQLSDERVRRAYDMVPLGGLFPWDRDVEAQIKRAAAAEASRRMAEEGAEVTTDDVLEEMGFREPPPPPDDGDGEPAEEPSRQALQAASRGAWANRWGHYVLSGPQGAPRADEALLEAWQGLVAAVLRERGIVMEFAVAQGHKGAPLVLRDSKEPCIFVTTTEDGISPELAKTAVDTGISLGYVAGNQTGGF
jgi:hypothetical protein